MLLQTSCVSWPWSHEFCDMITVSRARWYLRILVLATYSMDIYNSIILNFNELILAEYVDSFVLLVDCVVVCIAVLLKRVMIEM
jgi:hypothetical protein